MTITTDEMCKLITTQIGLPLPTYNYEYRKYESVVPENIIVNGKVNGTGNTDYHDTFKEACERIIQWHYNTK